MTEPLLVGSILMHADEAVAEWVRRQVPHLKNDEWASGFHALGVVRNGKFVGGVVYHEYRTFDIHLTAAFDRKSNWALPGTLRALATYPFETLGCVRLTAMAGRKNKRARKALEKIGFTFVGVAKRGLDGFEDAMLYELLKENCRWLHELQSINAAAVA